MGIIFNQQDNRSELQKKIAVELAEKAKKRSRADSEIPDGVVDSAYIEGTKLTTSLAWVWIIIFLAAVSVAIWYVVMGGNQG